MAEYWFTDTETLREFGNILTAAGILEDSDDFSGFLTSPFEYDSQYNAWIAAGSPTEGDDGWDEFVDSITEDEEEEE